MPDWIIVNKVAYLPLVSVDFSTTGKYGYNNGKQTFGRCNRRSLYAIMYNGPQKKWVDLCHSCAIRCETALTFL